MNTDEREANREAARCLKRRSVHKKRRTTIAMHPQLLALGMARAKALGYESFSDYLAGLTLFDAAMQRAHWLTRDVISDEGLLEKMLAEVATMPRAEWPAYFEVRIDQLATPATEGQLRRLRFYRLEFPTWLKKGAATTLIDDYKAAHPESEAQYQAWKSAHPE